MIPFPHLRRAANAGATVAFCMFCLRTAVALPGGDAITSHVASIKTSPPPLALVADPPRLTSTTISLDQWEIPLEKMEWDTRPRPMFVLDAAPSRYTGYLMHIARKASHRAYRLYNWAARRFDIAATFYF